jgi:hypothetical protein
MADPINLEYFQGLEKSIQGCASCEQLQQLTTETFSSLTATLTTMQAQLTALQPLLALLSAPGANPAALATWITDFITGVLTPQLKPVLNLPIQIAAITSQMSSLASAINAKAAEFESCTIPIPTIPPTP